MCQSLPPLASTAWKEVRVAIKAKIDAIKAYSERIERHNELMQLWAEFHAVGAQIYLAPDETNTPELQLMALAACVNHLPKRVKDLHAVRVVKQDEISVTFEVPSISSPGTFYRPTLYKNDCSVTCSCEGRSRTGHCWHQLACREAFCLMQPMACLQDVVSEDEFARADDLSDAAPDRFKAMFDAAESLPVYPSEAAKFEKPNSLTPEKRATVGAGVNVDYFALWNED